MRPLRINHATTSEINATVSTDGSPATGATVTLSIDYEGTNLVSGASMSHEGAGVYSYTVSSSLLPDVNELYDLTVVAVDSGNTSTYVRKLRTVKQDL